MAPQTKAAAPRTMKAEREAYYRKCLEHIVLPKLGVELLAELDAEREVSRKLAEALRKARHTLVECSEDTIGTPAELLFRDEVARCDAALAQYTAGGDDGGRERG